MKASSLTAEQRKRLQIARFKAITPSFTISNGTIYSFAVNEVTSELLYADVRGIHLFACSTDEELKSIPYTDMIKQEISRYSERKQLEILATYSSHGVQYLNVIQTMNIWLGVISRKRFVFFSEELAVSNESPIDISGITSLKVHSETGDIFTLTGDGKILMWGSEVISDTGKKRVSDFDVKIIMKKKFPCDGIITRFDIATGPFYYVVGVGESLGGSVQIWDYVTGDKLPSIQHSEPASVSISAIGIRQNYIVIVDSMRNISIYDLNMQCEVHKRSLGASVASVDVVLIEESELSSGVYLINSMGKVFDYSVTNAMVLSVFTHSRARERENLPVSSPKTEKNFLATLRSTQLDERAAPGSVFSRFNTCFRLITLGTGRVQIWALYNGTLDILNLASTGRVVELGGIIDKVRKVQSMQNSAVAHSSLMEVHMDTGSIGLFDIGSEKPPSFFSSYLDLLQRRHERPSIAHLTLDFSSIVTISESGGLLCYDYTTKSHSQDYQLSKITVTAICLAPKYAAVNEESEENNNLSIVIGTDSGVLVVFEYSHRTKTIESKRRYAGHDLVVSLHYRPWDRRVLTIGRDGYLKFLQCDQYYEWDPIGFKGYWNDCTASALCGRSMVLLGYESGMLQTLYFSPTATSPTSALLEYHTTNITSVCGLESSLTEGVSGDSNGNMVLWNLETSEPLKLLTLYSRVDALISFGSHIVESLFAVTNGTLVKLNTDRSVLYRKVTKRDVNGYKTEAKRRRMDNRKKKERVNIAGFTMRAKPNSAKQQGTVADLYTRVTETKEKLSPDPVEAVKLKTNRGKSAEEEGILYEIAGKTVDERFKDRALSHIIEGNHVERFKKSLAITIKHCNQWIPRELMFNGRFKTRSLLVTPCQSRFPGIKTGVDRNANRQRHREESIASVYMTRSLSQTLKTFASSRNTATRSAVNL